ncbi:MAG: hypothetical protein R2867_39045 [Caldilineaceae bacterium]
MWPWPCRSILYSPGRGAAAQHEAARDGVYRTLFFLPSIVPDVASAMLWA